MRVLSTILLLLAGMSSVDLLAQNCNIDHFNPGYDYTSYLEFRDDGVAYIEFTIYASKVKGIQARYKFSNYIGETNWVNFDQEPLFWGVNPFEVKKRRFIIPWYDRNQSYTIIASSRAQCTDGSWTDWDEVATISGDEVYCTSNFWLESKNVGARSVTFNYTYGAKYTEVQLSRDGGRTWPISKVGDRYATSITINNLDPNTEYTHRHRIQCNGVFYNSWADFNADGARITPFYTDCAKPYLGDLTTSNVNTGTGIEIHSEIPAQKYQFRIREKGNSTWITSPETTRNFYVFTNLQKFVIYELQCRVTCNTSGVSLLMDWSDTKEHAIPGTCAQPLTGDIGAKNIGTKTATLFCRSGHGDGIIERHTFRYRINSTDNWTERRTTTNEIEIKNLTDNTLYAMQVQHECTGGITGNWSPLVFFTTEQKCKIEADKINIRNIGFDQAELRCSVDRAAYLWKYRKAGGGGLVELPQQTTNRIQINGLSPGTTYEVALKVFCDPAFSDTYTDWVTFTTDICHTPEAVDMTVTDITNHTASLYYVHGSQGEHTWQYRKLGNTNWKSIQSLGEFTAITNLVANAEYEYRLKQNCSSNTGSGWSPISTFITTCSSSIRRFSNITASTIKVYSTNTMASTYTFRYKIRGGANWISPAAVAIPELLITNLTANTEYEFQVAANCIGNNFEWSQSAVASTRVVGLQTALDTRSVLACDYPRLYEISASNISDHSAELGCSRENKDGYIFRYADKVDSTWIMKESTVGTLVIDNLLPVHRYLYQVRFKCGSELSEWSDTSHFITRNEIVYLDSQCYRPGLVQLFPNQIGIATANLMCRANAEKYQFRYKELNTNTWTTIPEQISNNITVTSLKPNTYYEFQCRLFCNGGFGSYSFSWFFNTQALASCVEPGIADFFAYDIDQTNAKMISLLKGDLYEFRYRMSTEKSWQYGDTLMTPIFELNDLEPNTRYLYQLRILCPNKLVSEFSFIKSFTTLPVCSSSDSSKLKVDSIDLTSARIRSEDSTRAVYIFRYRSINSTDWIYLDPAVFSKIKLQNLKSNTKYECQVSNGCAENDFSVWSKSVTFSTSISTAIKNNRLERISVYPNPANNQLFINLDKTVQINQSPIFRYSVYDISGKNYSSGNIRANESIQVSHLSPGLYILVLNNGDASKQLKITITR